MCKSDRQILNKILHIKASLTVLTKNLQKVSCVGSSNMIK